MGHIVSIFHETDALWRLFRHLPDEGTTLRRIAATRAGSD
jgi:hypothetical protein